MTQTFQDWFVATPARGDVSNRIANTLFVSQATIAISQLATVAGLTVLSNLSSGISTVTATTITNVLDRTIGSAQGQILYRNAASWVFLPAGGTGQVLKTGGANNNPSWVGGLVLLNTLTPNGVASTNDTSSFSSSFSNYMIVFENVCPAVNTSTFQLTVATSGSNFISGAYFSQVNGFIANNGNLVTDYSTTVILLSGSRATTAVASSSVSGVCGNLFMQNSEGSNVKKQINGNISYEAPGGLSTSSFGGIEVSALFNSTSAITGLNFSFDAGNIATGIIKIYGMA